MPRLPFTQEGSFSMETHLQFVSKKSQHRIHLSLSCLAYLPVFKFYRVIPESLFWPICHLNLPYLAFTISEMARSPLKQSFDLVTPSQHTFCSFS